MNMLKQLNAAIEYIETNLCAEFDLDTAAGIACVTADSFIRFFSYMTGMTLTEYVRRRRLTLAAQDLQHGKTPIIGTNKSVFHIISPFISFSSCRSTRISFLPPFQRRYLAHS